MCAGIGEEPWVGWASLAVAAEPTAGLTAAPSANGARLTSRSVALNGVRLVAAPVGALPPDQSMFLAATTTASFARAPAGHFDETPAEPAAPAVPEKARGGVEESLLLVDVERRTPARCRAGRHRSPIPRRASMELSSAELMSFAVAVFLDERRETAWILDERRETA